MSKRASSARTLCALLLALAPAVPRWAHAAEPPSSAADAGSARISELNEAGARAYSGRNYRAAIERFVEAYAIDHDPNLLFNIARCYEKLGEIDAAVEKYEAFLAAPGADTEGRIKARVSLTELSRLRAQGAGASDPAPQTEGSSAPSETQAPASAARHTVLTWTALGAGLLATGFGATFYALGVHDHRQVTSAAGFADPTRVYPMTRSEAQAYVSSGDTKKLVGGVGLGLGGALLATSLVLLLTGSEHEPRATDSAALALTPAHGGLLVGYSGRF
jgi:hypothetical protein